MGLIRKQAPAKFPKNIQLILDVTVTKLKVPDS